MSKRLQVLVNPKEYKAFMLAAKSKGVSLGEWVRQSLRKSVREYSSKDPGKMLKKIEAISAQSNYPTSDIDQMLAEIEKGRFK
jgi:hypothetical protein